MKVFTSMYTGITFGLKIWMGTAGAAAARQCLLICQNPEGGAIWSCLSWLLLSVGKSPVRSWVATFFFEPLDAIRCHFLSFHSRRPAIFMFLGIAPGIRKRLVAHLWPVACTCATLRHLSSCFEGLLKEFGNADANRIKFIVFWQVYICVAKMRILLLLLFFSGIKCQQK